MLKILMVMAFSSSAYAATNVRDFGAKGDGATDDHAAVQAALDAGAGGVVNVPAGRYLLGKGSGPWCIRVPAGTTLQGASGAVLVQAVVGGSVNLIQVEAAGVTISGLELDGQRSLQVPDEHRAGVFGQGATGLVVTDVVSHDFTGDGFKVHTGSNGVTLTRLTATSNVRHGVSFAGCTTGASVTSSTFSGNLMSQLESEGVPPCHADAVTVTGNLLDSAGVSSYFALSIASDATARASGWVVNANTILGGISITATANIGFTGNQISTSNDNPAVYVYQGSDGVALTDNTLSTSSAPAVVEIVGNTVGIPDHVVLAHNTVTSTVTTGMGIEVRSGRTITLLGNTVIGAGGNYTYAYGVYARSIVAGSNLVIAARGNAISGWGSTGMRLSETGGGITSVEFGGNAAGSLWLEGLDVIAYGNTGTVLHTPDGAHSTWGSGDRWH